MAKFLVTEVTEIRTTYEVDADNAPNAINRVKSRGFKISPKQSIEQHFIAKVNEEEK